MVVIVVLRSVLSLEEGGEEVELELEVGRLAEMWEGEEVDNEDED